MQNHEWLCKGAFARRTAYPRYLKVATHGYVELISSAALNHCTFVSRA